MRCVAGEQEGCFNVSRSAPGGDAVLPAYVPSLHDHVTVEGCAAACFSLNATVAGIEGGSHCYCGGMNDIAAGASRARPDAECLPPSCPNTYGDGCSCTGNTTERCGALGRLFAYRFSCERV